MLVLRMRFTVSQEEKSGVADAGRRGASVPGALPGDGATEASSRPSSSFVEDGDSDNGEGESPPIDVVDNDNSAHSPAPNGSSTDVSQGDRRNSSPTSGRAGEVGASQGGSQGSTVAAATAAGAAAGASEGSRSSAGEASESRGQDRGRAESERGRRRRRSMFGLGGSVLSEAMPTPRQASHQAEVSSFEGELHGGGGTANGWITWEIGIGKE